MKNRSFEIDLVYLWVDGNDPVWQAKRNAFIGGTDENSPINCKGRYANNDELKYSLRSIEMYAPWIRKIFIVTDNQIPEWLDTFHPKVQIVDHTEILPSKSLPCFNSSLIEKHIYKIPGLAERFLCANDDTFINKSVNPCDFFSSEGFPIVRLKRKPLRKLRWFWREKICRNPLKNYSKMVNHSSILVEKKYGIYYTGMPHHNIDSYIKKDYQHIVEVELYNEFLANDNSHIRNDKDIHRSVISYISLAKKRGLLRYVTSKESMLVRIHKKKDYDKLQKYNPLLFCMNDSEYAQDNDRIMAKEYLEQRFPNKSQFEK